MKIGWNTNHQYKFIILKDKDSLVDTEIPKLLWVIKLTATSYMKLYKFIKLCKYIAQVPKVQVFKLFFYQKNQAFFEMCTILGLVMGKANQFWDISFWGGVKMKWN